MTLNLQTNFRLAPAEDLNFSLKFRSREEEDLGRGRGKVGVDIP